MPLVSDYVQQKPKVANIFIPVNAVNIATENTLWTPTAGKKFRLMGGWLAITGAAANVQLKDGTGGTLFAIIPLLTLSQGFLFTLGDGYLSATANNLLRALGVTSSVVNGTLWGREE